MEKSRVQTAVDYNLKWGYNCSQAVALTYADKFNLDPTYTARRLLQPVYLPGSRRRHSVSLDLQYDTFKVMSTEIQSAFKG